ncbi:hypothetical protein H671_6g15724 [Cricetulus griseus]|uniref:Uncharacterized protein n=2 Tax=Cricetulus griseus TaxID=10029 RepID=A0A061HXN3_CRIGR|nr:hypothetical protein H671_6g15724 [Cricetulus griseus]
MAIYVKTNDLSSQWKHRWWDSTSNLAIAQTTTMASSCNVIMDPDKAFRSSTALGHQHGFRLQPRQKKTAWPKVVTLVTNINTDSS